jgi:hypothetical protein
MAGQCGAMTKQAAAAAFKPESLQSVFDELHQVLIRFVPPYVAKSGEKKDRAELHLLVPKPVTIPGAYGGTPKQIGLAAIVLQKSYVGLYYLPLYLDPKLGKQLSPGLMKFLKGKTCFHIKQRGEELERDIESALKIGTSYFRDQGWI